MASFADKSDAVEKVNAVSLKDLASSLSNYHEDVLKLQKGSLSPIRRGVPQLPDPGPVSRSEEIKTSYTPAEWGAMIAERDGPPKKATGRKFVTDTDKFAWASRMREAKSKKRLQLLKSKPAESNAKETNPNPNPKRTRTRDPATKHSRLPAASGSSTDSSRRPRIDTTSKNPKVSREAEEEKEGSDST